MMLGPDVSFWKGKRTLVTGSTGFKGSWLCLWLQSLGAEVCGFALPPETDPSLFEGTKLDDEIRSEIGDIRDPNQIKSAIESFCPEIVLHLAAQPLVRRSYDNPVETYSTNVMGLVNLLEAIRKVETVQAVVNVTSDKCYENRDWVWTYRESDRMGGFDPYSSSKGCAEVITSAYRDSYFRTAGIGLASARSGNVIGGGDWSSDRLVPDVLRALERNEPVRIRNPHAIRPWQHVLEPLSGYLLLAERLFMDGARFSEPWNFGPEQEDAKQVRWIVERLAVAWGAEATWCLEEAEQPHEAATLKLDISKARDALGWHPRWNLATTLEKTVDWHRAWLENRDMRHKCLEQIEQYSEFTR